MSIKHQVNQTGMVNGSEVLKFKQSSSPKLEGIYSIHIIRVNIENGTSLWTSVGSEVGLVNPRKKL